MAILVDDRTECIVQGITGREGAFHTKEMLRYGTRIVAGVTPGKGGEKVEEIPVFNTMREAVQATGATASVIFVPPPFAADAILEAHSAGISLCTCITDGVPVHDMVHVVSKISGMRLIGPNCPGLVSPGQCKVGIIPNSIVSEGNIGIISRSGTLTYELLNELKRRGAGESTCVGIGGDPIIGMRFKDVLPLFEEDPQTEKILLVGEIGGEDEEQAAEVIQKMQTPVFAFISGRTAPPGKRMGHAGAIISGKKGTAESKLKAFQAAKVPVAESLHQLIDMVSPQ